MPPKAKKTVGAGKRKAAGKGKRKVKVGKGVVKDAVNHVIAKGFHWITGNVFKSGPDGVKARAQYMENVRKADAAKRAKNGYGRKK